MSAQPPEIASKLTHLRPGSLDGPNLLVIEPSAGYNWVIDACERPDLRVKIESALRGWLDRPVEIRFDRPIEVKAPAPARNPASLAGADGLGDDPLVKLVAERLEARLVRLEYEDEPPPGP